MLNTLNETLVQLEQKMSIYNGWCDRNIKDDVNLEHYYKVHKDVAKSMYENAKSACNIAISLYNQLRYADEHYPFDDFSDAQRAFDVQYDFMCRRLNDFNKAVQNCCYIK